MPTNNVRALSLVLCTILAAVSLTSEAQKKRNANPKSFDSNAVQTAYAALEREVRADMTFLADDDLHGRGSATRD